MDAEKKSERARETYYVDPAFTTPPGTVTQHVFRIGSTCDASSARYVCRVHPRMYMYISGS